MLSLFLALIIISLVAAIPGYAVAETNLATDNGRSLLTLK